MSKFCLMALLPSPKNLYTALTALCFDLTDLVYIINFLTYIEKEKSVCYNTIKGKLL